MSLEGFSFRDFFRESVLKDAGFVVHVSLGEKGAINELKKQCAPARTCQRDKLLALLSTLNPSFAL